MNWEEFGVSLSLLQGSICMHWVDIGYVQLLMMRLRLPSDLPEIPKRAWDVDNGEKQGMLGQEIHSPMPAVLNL